MLDENKKDLCKYRIEKSHECLKSAELLKNSGDYTSSANRSYYSIFHAMRAVMALTGILVPINSICVCKGKFRYCISEVWNLLLQLSHTKIN